MTNVKNNSLNLFDYATSELSQDAFLCWLLAHHPICQNEDSEIKDKDISQCAENLLNELLGKHSTELGKITELEIKRQYKKIDILVIINKKYGLIIEDKTDTSEHGNQLGKYFKVVEKKGLIPLGIYFKTGDELKRDEIKRDEIKNKSDEDIECTYKTFYRDELLEVLKKHKTKNDIFTSFYNRLKKFEEDYKSYENNKVADWSSRAWSGFFHNKLYKNDRQNFDKFWYGYVPNRSGGFLCFAWEFRYIDKIKVYFQFEIRKVGNTMNPILVVKTSCENKPLPDVALNKIDEYIGKDLWKKFKRRRSDGKTSSRLIYILEDLNNMEYGELIESIEKATKSFDLK